MDKKMIMGLAAVAGLGAFAMTRRGEAVIPIPSIKPATVPVIGPAPAPTALVGNPVAGVAVVAAVKQGVLPISFTATSQQLTNLEAAGYSIYSGEYQKLIGLAYAVVAQVAAPDQVVGWSVTDGYHLVQEGSAEWWGISEDSTYPF